MAQFDVYRNTNEATKRTVPYLLDLQSDLLSDLATRVVVPLMLASRSKRKLTRLNPTFRIEGVDVVMSTAELAAIHRRFLGERVASVGAARTEIVAAFDVIIQGV
jgi:toxin CcdB